MPFIPDRDGKGRKGPERNAALQAPAWGKRFQEPQDKPFDADSRLPKETVCRILHCLVQSNSVRGTAWLCDVGKRTVLNILTLAGEACERLFTERVRNVQVKDLECDEIWSFVGGKQRWLTPARVEKGVVGDAYTFIGLERPSKLVVAWHLSKRGVSMEDFVSKIRCATPPGRFDVTTDGFEPYETAIDAGLYDRANHSAEVKLFSNRLDRVTEGYRPAKFVSVQKNAVTGNPDLDRAGTSHIERKNGTVRQWCKRLTRLTYAFSKKGQSESGAGAAHHVWEIADLISPL